MGKSTKGVRKQIPGLIFFILVIGWITPILVLNDIAKSLRSPRRLAAILVASALWGGTLYSLYLKLESDQLSIPQALGIFAVLCSWRLVFLPAVNWFAQGRPREVADTTLLSGEEFYRSRAWQDLRYRTLRKFGKKCMLCGSTKGSMHVDHIRPRSKHPEAALDPANLQILCRTCNFGKGNIYTDDFRGS